MATQERVLPHRGTIDRRVITGQGSQVYNSPTIRACGCKHKEQDKMYGEGQRLHNEQGGKSKGKLRCSVCGLSK
jgi:hypothetical protein